MHSSAGLASCAWQYQHLRNTTDVSRDHRCMPAYIYLYMMYAGYVVVCPQCVTSTAVQAPFIFDQPTAKQVLGR